MRLVTYKLGDVVRLGAVVSEEIIDLSELHTDMLELIEEGDLLALQQSLEDREKVKLSEVELISPIHSPRRNILCIGWNYLEHFEERHQQHIKLPEVPTVFTKATKTVTGPYNDIYYSEKNTKKFDYEAELAVVIGKEGRDISVEDAEDYIFGYTVANDLSARDLQQSHGGQWFMGKSLDNSCPLGPWLVTKDEIEDVQSLEISCKVNGEVVQSSNTNLMIFPITQIIAELSKGMTLVPGDIILTGTPSGVGFKRQPPILLSEGDIVEVFVQNIGNIKNTIKLLD